MKTSIPTMILVLICNAVSAQKKSFTDCHSATRYFARPGEEITFYCDSILLLNPQAYHTLDSTYHQLYCLSQRASHQADSITSYYQQLYAIKSNQLIQWQKTYVKLKDSALIQSNHVNETLHLINNNTTSSKMNLSKADSLTTVSIENFKQTVAHQRKQKIKSGLVGFGLGVVLTIIAKSL